MKVLIVSFDKTLTENLKKALVDHDVYVAKNSEEAIKMFPSDIEGVIYDAISGAISEEDINTLYTKRFSNARYLILYDELFPVDENNIIAPHKILVPRDENPENIVQKLVEFPSEPQEVSEFEIKPVEEGSEDVQEFEIEPTTFDTPVFERESEVAESFEEVTQSVEEVLKKKILVVSFDQTLIDSLEASLGHKYEIDNVKTVKQAIEQGKDASLIVFDAISGVIAEKGLMDMANDNTLSQKPYVILIDDLFPINVDNIPLKRKIAVSRDTDSARLKEIIEEQIGEAAEASRETQEISAEEQMKESIEVEPPPQEFEIEAGVSEEIPEIEIEKVKPSQEFQEVSPEEEIPALETLEKIIEEKKIEAGGTETPKAEEEKETAEESVSLPEIDVDSLIENAVAKALSEEKIKDAVSKALEERTADIKEMVADIIRREMERVFEELDMKNLIREITYQALKEKLNELIT